MKKKFQKGHHLQMGGATELGGTVVFCSWEELGRSGGVSSRGGH